MRKNRKYTAEFRLKIVKEYLRGNSIRGLSDKWKVPRTLLQKWVDNHRTYGAIGLFPKKHQYYSKEFKCKVVQNYHKKQLSLRDCCLHYNLPTQSTLVSWLRKYKLWGLDGLSEQRGRPKTMKENKSEKKPLKTLSRIEELEKENLYLRAENELLKKLEALAQNRETPLKKKR